MSSYPIHRRNSIPQTNEQFLIDMPLDGDLLDYSGNEYHANAFSGTPVFEYIDGRYVLKVTSDANGITINPIEGLKNFYNAIWNNFRLELDIYKIKQNTPSIQAWIYLAYNGGVCDILAGIDPANTTQLLIQRGINTNNHLYSTWLIPTGIWHRIIIENHDFNRKYEVIDLSNNNTVLLHQNYIPNYDTSANLTYFFIGRSYYSGRYANSYFRNFKIKLL
jgi:hypothetical protein